jgi:CBS domain-containing protein
MTRNVKTAGAGSSLRDVAAIMRDGDMGAVPVVDGTKLIGIVTDRDIVIRGIAEGASPETPVSDVMTRELFSVRPDDFVFEAIRLMGGQTGSASARYRS